MSEYIPVNQPLLDGNEKKYLAECIDSGWISSEGPFVSKFEEQFALLVNRRYAIAVSNGSVALDAAIVALGISGGDEVILPTFTIISCASAIIRAGAIPVVVDSDPITWNMDVSQIENKITKRTKAIMVVHIYGLPVEMDLINALASKYGLYIIEDAAELIGQTYKGTPCGSFGTISTFSFYPNKHITSGEGGMIVTDDPVLAERCRSLRNLCFQNHKRFVHEEMGWNFRMTNLQAAVGLAQLERLEDFLKRKRFMGKFYSENLADIPGLQLPLSETSYAENIYWVYGLILNDEVKFDAEEIMKKLNEFKIGTRPFFWPMHSQPVFQRLGLFDKVTCPVAERMAVRGFYIPSGLTIDELQMLKVVNSIREVMKCAFL
jgi:perosamine synthetase